MAIVLHLFFQDCHFMEFTKLTKILLHFIVLMICELYIGITFRCNLKIKLFNYLTYFNYQEIIKKTWFVGQLYKTEKRPFPTLESFEQKNIPVFKRIMQGQKYDEVAGVRDTFHQDSENSTLSNEEEQLIQLLLNTALKT